MRSGWAYVVGRGGNKAPVPEKVAITAACEKFTTEVLRPRFVPDIRPTAFNYPVAIEDNWHSNKYRFITCYRSDDSRSYASEFEAHLPAWNTSLVIASPCPGTATLPVVCLFQRQLLTKVLQLTESELQFEPY